MLPSRMSRIVMVLRQIGTEGGREREGGKGRERGGSGGIERGRGKVN